MQSKQFPVEQLDDSTEGCSLTAGSGSNMLVAVRLRPLNCKEIASGYKSCCKVINSKVRKQCNACTQLHVVDLAVLRDEMLCGCLLFVFA